MSGKSGNGMLNNIEIAKRNIVLESQPRRLIVTLSTKCNSQCIMCEVRHNKWEIPRKTLREIVALFPVLESVAWQGGEVFYMDFFRELFEEALKHDNLHQTVVSNGLLLSEKIIEKLVRARMELAISVDGTTKEVYEKIRSGSRFDVLLKNLRMLRDARMNGTDGQKLQLRLHTVVMRSNYGQMGTFIEFAREYGFNALHMMPLWGNRVPEEDIFARRDVELEKKVREQLQRTMRKAQEYGVEFMSSLPVSAEEAAPSSRNDGNGLIQGGDVGEKLLCLLPWQQLNVDPGGGVRPGCLCPESVGSVEQSSIGELWNGERMQDYRRKIIARDGAWCNRHCVSGEIPRELRRI